MEDAETAAEEAVEELEMKSGNCVPAKGVPVVETRGKESKRQQREVDNGENSYLHLQTKRNFLFSKTAVQTKSVSHAKSAGEGERRKRTVSALLTRVPEDCKRTRVNSAERRRSPERQRSSADHGTVRLTVGGRTMDVPILNERLSAAGVEREMDVLGRRTRRRERCLPYVSPFFTCCPRLHCMSYLYVCRVRLPCIFSLTDLRKSWRRSFKRQFCPGTYPPAVAPFWYLPVCMSVSICQQWHIHAFECVFLCQCLRVRAYIIAGGASRDSHNL